jgi:signal transduction histidine kinase
MPIRRPRGALTGAPDARALIALLLLTLVLSGLLAFEAEQEVGAHRVASARVLREHLAATGRDALDATAAALRASLVSALGPAVDARAATPYDVLPSPTALAARSGTRLGCAVPGPVWMRLDLRDGSLATAGYSLPPAVGRWAADAARAIARGGATATDGGYAIVTGRGAMAGRVVVLGVKRAPYDAPIAVYGLITCDDVFGAALLGAARRTGVGGDALSLALADSLLAIEVRDASGALLGPAPVRGAARPGAPVVAERRVAGLTLRAVEGPGAAGRVLVPTRRRTRVLVVGALAAITGALGLLALRQLRREQELVRLRADFTSSVSHELRTPLAQILLYGETLALGRVRDDAQRRDAADTIVREARRLMHMVENVLHAARAERRANPVHTEVVALAPLVREVARGFAPLAEAAGMRLDVDVPGSLGARADTGALRQILLNLLDNALRYGAHAQTIRVAAREEAGATVRLWVDDAGPGIAPRDRQRVWLPFVRLARDRQAGNRTGSGLGLAVVADLVRALDGEAWITDAPGGGTRVCVRLPAVALADARGARDDGPSARAVAEALA